MTSEGEHSYGKLFVVATPIGNLADWTRRAEQVVGSADLILCEDGPEEQFLVGVTPGGEIYKLARNVMNHSEFAGAAFAPDGSTLFVNIQW